MTKSFEEFEVFANRAVAEEKAKGFMLKEATWGQRKKDGTFCGCLQTLLVKHVAGEEGFNRISIDCFDNFDDEDSYAAEVLDITEQQALDIRLGFDGICIDPSSNPWRNFGFNARGKIDE